MRARSVRGKKRLPVSSHNYYRNYNRPASDQEAERIEKEHIRRPSEHTLTHKHSLRSPPLSCFDHRTTNRAHFVLITRVGNVRLSRTSAFCQSINQSFISIMGRVLCHMLISSEYVLIWSSNPISSDCRLQWLRVSPVLVIHDELLPLRWDSWVWLMEFSLRPTPFLISQLFLPRKSANL